MKKLLVSVIAVSALTLGVATCFLANDARAQINPILGFDEVDNRHVLPVHPRLVQNFAMRLCLEAVRSGAYAELDDDELSTFCMNTAEHIYKGDYDHVPKPQDDEEE